MKRFRLAKLFFAATLSSFLSSPAWAGSTTQPGFTTGIPLYTTEFPTGLYLDLVPTFSARDSDPKVNFNAVSPFFTLQVPGTVLNGKLWIVAAPVFGNLQVKSLINSTGFYNSYFGTQINWNLGNNWGWGIRLAGWIPQSGVVAEHYGTFAPRIGITYLSAKQNFTASFERGYTLGYNSRTVPNYVNLDLTYTRTIGKFEYGAVSFLSADTNRPFSGYQQQAQAAVGPLVGYDFGLFRVQAKLTSDVYENHYGGYEKRAEFNIYIPLWNPKG